MASNSIEWQLCAFMRRAIQLGMGVDPSQTTISILPLRDANWTQFPMFQVIPGAVRPDGGGRGEQEGGALKRIQQIKIVVYTKLDLSQYTYSDAQLMDPAQGELDLFERLLSIFKQTYFGNQDGSQCLLTEPLWFVSSSATQWVDQQTGLVSRELVWDATYSLVSNWSQTGITIFQPAVAFSQD